jgi:ABC-2 type transport system permease protein
MSGLVSAGAAQPAPALLSAGRHWWTVALVTAVAFLRRTNAYVIDIIRWPIFPLISFAVWRIGYDIAGRSTVDGASAPAFLLVGMIGQITWTATVWGGGYAVEYEREGGTIGALFLSPASRTAVVTGYGLGSLVWMLPAFVSVTILGVATGARLNIADPLAALAALLALIITSLGAGFLCASLFVLTRRANLVANTVQLPVSLLAGFLVPRTELPSWLMPLSDAVPASHAVDALRASALSAATFGDIVRPLAWALGLSVLYAALGFAGLRRIEHAAKRSGQLELY